LVSIAQIDDSFIVGHASMNFKPTLVSHHLFLL
jgi:hypothetical protein